MSKKPDKDFYDIVGKVEAAISLLPMPDLIHDKKVGALVAELKYKVNEFVNNNLWDSKSLDTHQRVKYNLVLNLIMFNLY